MDPTQGFIIKTNFPKMENKSKQTQKTKKTPKKQESHLNKKPQKYCFFFKMNKKKQNLLLCGLVPLRFRQSFLAVVFFDAILRSHRLKWWRYCGPSCWRIPLCFVRTPKKITRFLQVSQGRRSLSFKIAARLNVENSKKW